jgi:dihydropyrimidinase
MSLLISGGLVVGDAGVFEGDVLVEGESIAALGPALEVPSGVKVIDARGKYVLPGGVDPHTHLDAPAARLDASTVDDFTSGTIAAAHGGTTTIVDFCMQAHGQGPAAALECWHEKLRRNPPVVDVGFHLAVTDLTPPGAIEELALMPAAGVTSFKLFMAYRGGAMVTDDVLFETMQIAARLGVCVLVHAESGDVIEVLVREALAEGKVAPIWHARTRPPLTESEATSRAITYAHIAGCSLYVVHVSCREALQEIADARAAGWPVWAETCTHYLSFTEGVLDRPGFEGAKYVYTPPPRTEADRAALWSAVRDGTLGVVSTDHTPFRFDRHKSAGVHDFSLIPNGAPGIEDRLRILHHFGVRAGRLDLVDLVRVTATEPAKLFGLYPRKGAIRIGADADLVIFDPEAEQRISARDRNSHHSMSDYNLYEGIVVRGVPEVVVVRGTVVVEKGQLRVRPGHGRFVKRARFAGAQVASASDAKELSALATGSAFDRVPLHDADERRRRARGGVQPLVRPRACAAHRLRPGRPRCLPVCVRRRRAQISRALLARGRRDLVVAAPATGRRLGRDGAASLRARLAQVPAGRRADRAGAGRRRRARPPHLPRREDRAARTRARRLVRRRRAGGRAPAAGSGPRRALRVPERRAALSAACRADGRAPVPGPPAR